MYYANRIELGQKLAGRLMDLKGQEAVVIALKESALSSCIGLASQVNAWVFPLLSQHVLVPGDPRIMGLIDPSGTFTWNPDLEKVERDGIEMESHGVLEEAKRQAFSRLNRSLEQFGEFSKDALNGRTLLLTGDIVEDRIEIAMALEYLKSVRYAKLYGLGGNVDAQAATYFHLQTDQDIALDVMTHMFPAEHYFEQQDAYSPEECRQLAINISHYWS
jgi:predicted phosphoribosyltransferase